jgi:acyl transferase domain-containing protein/phosphopantetheinyl transferase (holo-ACP synthase)
MTGADVQPGVAITGMACLFPGAGDVAAYWRNILGKVDATSEPPPEAWDPDVYYDPGFADTDRTYCKRGGYLGSLASFDPLANGIPPVAVGGEPDQWLALQVARDALADAGADDLPDAVRTRTSIVLGKGTYLNGGNAVALQRGLVVGQTIDLLRRLHPEHSEEYLEALRIEMGDVLPPLSADTVPGLIPNIIVGRIANRLDLNGPAYTVDAACASSLVAIRHAVRDLLDGDCDLALAGGSQVWMPAATMNLFSRLGALSRRQSLRAFDKDADGTLLGEGIGIIVLKRVADAVRDGDRVYAVIRGVGISSDGHGVSVMAPRVEGEEIALRRAYSAAGVSPDSVDLVEAHGTGTPVGDVAEVTALTRVFGERGGELPHCALGSVKSMISHTIPAAGVASVIKSALALHHRVLPPTLCDEPNPKLELERTPFYINTETRPWVHGGPAPRRAGVNAFGFGGINAHAVLEEFDGPSTGTRSHRPPWATELCLLEGSSAAEHADAADRLAGAIPSHPGWSLTDLAATLAGELGTVTRPRRLAVVAASLEDLQAKLGQAAERLRTPDCRRIKAASGIYYEAEPLGPTGQTVFVFPGEGAQYPHMLSELCLQFDEVRAVFDQIDRLYVGHPRGHLLSDWVFPRPAFSEDERRRATERLMELDIAVESVLTANAAVHAILSRLVPRVDALVGHSTGEHSAAMAAGVLDLSTDERLATFCHGLHASYDTAASANQLPAATLLALGTGAAEARAIADAAGGELYVAMDNCPHQVVLVGDPRAAERARAHAAAQGVMCEVLPYDRAVHTPLFAPYADELRAVFDRLPVRATDAGLWSCTTAAPYPTDVAVIRELLVEHWTSPVRFTETIEALHDDGARVFIEVGPRGNLTAFTQDILRGKPMCAVAADGQRRSGVTGLNHLVGLLAAHDVELDTAPLFAGRAGEPLDWSAAAPAPTPSPSRMRLSTGWPMLRLDGAALARLGAVRAAHEDSGGEGSAPVPNGSAPVPNGSTPAPNGHAPAPNGHAPVLAAAVPAPVLSAAALVTDDALTAALDAHLETMGRFLETSRHVMRAYLDDETPAGGRPLIGSILACDPGITLLARRVVDPEHDRYLLDHALGRHVSHLDPELGALAVMPLAMSIEILAEGAACLLPELVVTGLREVRAHRWLDFEAAPRTLEVSARRIEPVHPHQRVAVTLSTVADDGETTIAAEGIVLLADDFTPAPATLTPPADGAPPVRLDPDRLYAEAMFHGPLWQGVAAIDTLAPHGAHARLRVPPRAGLLPGTPAPEFVLDPVTLDAAGQLIGFWAADRLTSGRVVFPFRLAALDLHGPLPPEGEVLHCVAEIALEGSQLVRSDVEVIDADGWCLMRLSGWEDKRFEVPERFAPLAGPERMAPLSSAWPLAFADAGAGPIATRRIDARIPADASLWRPVWSHRVLGRRERAQLAARSGPESRQLERLGARTAAKEAVADLLRLRLGIDLLPADIEILADARGAPRVSLPGGGELGVTPIVSLTHSHGLAAAAAALAVPGARAGIGIDIERLQPRPEGFAAAALGPAERQLLSAADPGAGEEWVLRCWCAKEAAGKAASTGVNQGAGAPQVCDIDPERQRIGVNVDGDRIVVQTSRDDDLVIATAVFGIAEVSR